MKDQNSSSFFWKEISSYGEYKYIKKGEYLYYKGDLGDEFFIILQGQIELSIFDLDGNEIIIDQIEAESHFGEMEIFTTRIRTTNAYASQDTQMLRFSSHTIRKFIQEDVRLAFLLIENLSHSLIRNIEYIEDLLTLDAYERVSKKIYELYCPQKAEALNISQKKIAQFLAISRETTNFSLKKLKVIGAINTARSQIEILDEQLLKKQFRKQKAVA